VGVGVGAAGAIVGGLAGKGVAESIDPTVEDAYWRENYATRDYPTPGRSFEDVEPELVFERMTETANVNPHPVRE
jgi:hypothetical protein